MQNRKPDVCFNYHNSLHRFCVRNFFKTFPFVFRFEIIILIFLFCFYFYFIFLLIYLQIHANFSSPFSGCVWLKLDFLACTVLLLDRCKDAFRFCFIIIMIFIFMAIQLCFNCLSVECLDGRVSCRLWTGNEERWTFLRIFGNRFCYPRQFAFI